MAHPLSRLASWSAAHPVIALSLVLVLVVGAGAGMAQAEPGRVQDLFVPDDLPAKQTLDEIEAIWGASDQTYFLYLTDDPTDAALLRAVAQDMEAVAGLPISQRVVGAPTLLEARLGPLADASDADIAQALAALQAAGATDALMADDALLVRIDLEPGQDVMATTDALDAIAAASTAEADLRSTGPVYIERAQESGAAADVAFLMPLSVVAVGLLLALLFRRTSDVLVPMATTLLAIPMAYGTVAWVGMPLAPPSFIVMPLLVGLGIDYMLHIVYAYREQDPSLSVAQRFHVVGARVGSPVFFTAVTTLIGFGSFLAGNVPQIRVWGLLIGSGALYAFILGFVALPALYRIRRRKHRVTKLPLAGIMDRTAGWLLERRIKVLAVVAVATIGLGLAASQIDVQRTLDFEPPSDDPAVTDLAMLQDRFGGQTVAVLFMPTGDVAALRSLETELAALEGVAFVDGPTTRLAQAGTPDAPIAGPAVADVATSDWWRVLIGYTEGDTATLSEVEAIAAASPLAPEVTGQQIIQRQSQSKVLDGLFLSTGVALVLVTALLFVVFRRPAAALLTALPLGVTIVWELGVMTLIGIPLNAVTGVITAMILGVGVDYALHIMSHFVEERKTRSSYEAARHALASVGRPVVVASISTVGAFSVLAFSSFQPLREFGITAAIVVTCAFLVTLLMLPAVLSFLPDRKGEAAPQRRSRRVKPTPQRAPPIRIMPPGHIRPRFEDPHVQHWYEQVRTQESEAGTPRSSRP